MHFRRPRPARKPPRRQPQPPIIDAAALAAPPAPVVPLGGLGGVPAPVGVVPPIPVGSAMPDIGLPLPSSLPIPTDLVSRAPPGRRTEIRTATSARPVRSADAITGDRLPLRHDAGVTSGSPSLADVIATLHVDQIDDDSFVATQLDNAAHHIVGGHLAGQALMAASRTTPGRTPHSVHVYYLRAGDARRPVEFQVVRSRDGGTLSTRQITARQDGEVLLEALASFSTPLDGLDYHAPMADTPDPESLLPIQEQLAPYADELGGYWVRSQPFDLRYVDPPPRLALELPKPSPHIRMWWRPTESVPADEVLHSCLLTYLSGTTMLETAITMRRATPITTFNALIDHALWFHRPVDLSDWVLSDQFSPSAIGGRGLATATMYNRTGEVVCIATQELYFGRAQTG